MSAIDDPVFTAALLEAEALPAPVPGRPRRRRPTRFLARDLLVPLGERLLEDPPSVAGVLTRLRAVIERDREGWEAAVREELTLAGTEHVRSCDPRALELPRYDFAYTVAARHRLEARLRAAAELDLPADETLLESIERADRLLSPYLDPRSG